MKFSTLLLLLVMLTNTTGASSTESAEWRVDPRGSEEFATCPAGIKFRFVANNKKRAITRPFEVASMMRMLRDVQVVGSKALLFGDLTHSGNMVLVYDLNSGRVLDEIYGYQFRLSPMHRYLAYLRFHPRFTPKEFISDVVLLYDPNKDAMANRLSSAATAPSPENGGVPVYPRYNVDVGVLSPELGSSSTVSVMQPMIWQEDKLLFLVRYESNRIEAVGVDFSPGLQQFCGSVDHLNKVESQQIVAGHMQARRAFLESTETLPIDGSTFGPGCGKGETMVE